jgi:hypothetical protein
MAPYGGTKFPAFLRMNNSPGSVWVSRVGSTRESEHVMNRARGDCWLERLLKRVLFSSNTSFRNRKKPLTSFSIIVFSSCVIGNGFFVVSARRVAVPESLDDIRPISGGYPISPGAEIGQTRLKTSGIAPATSTMQ